MWVGSMLFIHLRAIISPISGIDYLRSKVLSCPGQQWQQEEEEDCQVHMILMIIGYKQ